MSSGKNFVEMQEAQPFEIVEESGEETEDEHGNAVGAVSRDPADVHTSAAGRVNVRNSGRARGPVGGSKDSRAKSTAVSSAAASTTAAATANNGAAARKGLVTAAPAEHIPASTAVQSPQSPLLGTSTNAVKPKALFVASISPFNISGAPINKDISLEDYQVLATNHFNASKALNKLRDEQQQCISIIDKCKVEKREWDLVAKEIKQRSDAATKRCKETMDEMCNVKAEQTAAEDKFMQANKAMCDPGEAGASKR